MTDAQNAPITIALPVADRRASSRFYQVLLNRQPFGPLADDGQPEPLQFWLGEGVSLMLVPTGGFGYVLGPSHQVAPRGQSEAVLSITLDDEAAVESATFTAVAAGGVVVTPPTAQPWAFQSMVADPDGHLWQIVAAQTSQDAPEPGPDSSTATADSRTDEKDAPS